MTLSSPQACTPYDVDVVGRGIVGLGLAYKLAKEGLKVRVIGESDPLCASRVATGIVSIKGENRQTTAPLFLLKIEGHRAVREFISDFSADFLRIFGDQKFQNFGKIFQFGIFEPLRDELDFKTTHKRVHHGENLEKYGTEFLTQAPENLNAFLCKNSSSLLGGFFYPQDFYFNCGYLLDNLEIVLKHLGVVFYEK
jgi:glycine/D-amino acid oxidase-like deaminating enzyme